MTSRVLFLSLSRGLGGGIERYVATVESAFAAEGDCQWLDLSGPGARAHFRLLAQARTVLRMDSAPHRPVFAQRRCWHGSLRCAERPP